MFGTCIAHDTHTDDIITMYCTSCVPHLVVNEAEAVSEDPNNKSTEEPPLKKVLRVEDNNLGTLPIIMTAFLADILSLFDLYR